MCRYTNQIICYLTVNRVKLRIKTDCQQFETKEDAINEEAKNIELEPVTSPSNEKQSPHLAPEQGEEADAHLVRILQSIIEHPVLLE